MGLRRVVRIVAATCFLGLALATVSASPASACSCVAGLDHFAEADAAFLGDVIAMRVEDPESVVQGPARLAGPSTVFTIDVQTVYKGEVRERQEVRSSLDGASCGAGFQINHRYVVYGRTTVGSHNIPMHTSLCDGTYAPDGVNTFPLPHSGWLPEHEHSPVFGDPESGEIVEPVGRPGASPAAFAGVILVSAMAAATLLALGGRT